jgi:PIN domain nuclease of toxin-antitoxin system
LDLVRECSCATQQACDNSHSHGSFNRRIRHQLLGSTVLLQKGRMAIDRDPLDWIAAGLSSPKVTLLPLTPAVAVTAMNLDLHGDPGDRLIAATALVENRVLVTRDAKLRAATYLRTIW